MVTVDDLIRALRGAVLDEQATEVVVDFAGVTFCDSSGLAALDSAYGEGLRRDTAFRLINVQPQVRRLLEIVGMLDNLVGAYTARHDLGRAIRAAELRLQVAGEDREALELELRGLRARLN